MSDARVWLVSESKPRLLGEKDKAVFGLSLSDANLEAGQSYHWKVWSNVKCTRKVSCGSTMAGPCECGSTCVARASGVASFVTDGQAPRWIALEGRIKNVRDLGGWRTRDGEFHEYALDLSANSDWKGKVDELWFEACQVNHARVAIDWMRFE